MALPPTGIYPYISTPERTFTNLEKADLLRDDVDRDTFLRTLRAVEEDYDVPDGMVGPNLTDQTAMALGGFLNERGRKLAWTPLYEVSDSGGAEEGEVGIVRRVVEAGLAILRRHHILAAILILGGPRALSAQLGPEKCGTAPNPESDLRTFVNALSRPYEVAMDTATRTLRPLAPGDTTAVMTDQQACRRVLDAGLGQLRANGQMKGFQATGFQHRVYGLGPYYMITFSDAVPEDPARPHTVVNLSPTFYLFFDVETMQFLGEVMRPG